MSAAGPLRLGIDRLRADRRASAICRPSRAATRSRLVALADPVRARASSLAALCCRRRPRVSCTRCRDLTGDRASRPVIVASPPGEHISQLRLPRGAGLPCSGREAARGRTPPTRRGSPTLSPRAVDRLQPPLSAGRAADRRRFPPRRARARPRAPLPARLVAGHGPRRRRCSISRLTSSTWRSAAGRRSSAVRPRSARRRTRRSRARARARRAPRSAAPPIAAYLERPRSALRRDAGRRQSSRRPRWRRSPACSRGEHPLVGSLRRPGSTPSPRPARGGDRAVCSRRRTTATGDGIDEGAQLRALATQRRILICVLQFDSASRLACWSGCSATAVCRLLASSRERAPGIELETPAADFAAGAFYTLYSGVELADHGIFYPFQWSPPSSAPLRDRVRCPARRLGAPGRPRACGRSRSTPTRADRRRAPGRLRLRLGL